MAHKYIKEELSAQRDIKKAGFQVTYIQDNDEGGTDSVPIVSKSQSNTYAVDISTDPKYNQRSGESQFRTNSGAVKFERAFMLSTEGFETNSPAVGNDILIPRTARIANTQTEGDLFQIVYVLAEAPAGVAIFYIVLLDGHGATQSSDDDIYATED